LAEGGMSCSILTRPALPELEHLHPRMPVMLSGDELTPWLHHGITDDDVRNNFGLSWSGQMKMHPVRPFGIHDDDPSLIEQDGFGF
jgi:putative SOS response-associated peptidase YedK